MRLDQNISGEPERPAGRPPPPGHLALHVRVAELVEAATRTARNIDEEVVA